MKPCNLIYKSLNMCITHSLQDSTSLLLCYQMCYHWRRSIQLTIAKHKTLNIKQMASCHGYHNSLNDIIVVLTSNDYPAVMETIEAYYDIIVVLTNNDNPAAMETMPS